MRTHALITKEAARPGLAPMQRARALRSILLGAGVQPKLRVGAVDDPAEAEADRTADRVMRMPDPKLVSSASEPPPDQRGILRRKCAQCEDEERVQRKETHGASHAGGALSPAAEAAVNSLGPGAPLPASERAFFEPRFGHSLGHVRVHDGAQADHAASSISARAFALGSSVAFARGEYQPGTRGGRELMAHELAHVGCPEPSGQIRRLQNWTGDCPVRTMGETARSRQSQMIVSRPASPEHGFVVWDFPVGSSRVKPNLASEESWTQAATLIENSADATFEIVGLSDCEGTTERNEALRAARASSVWSLLSPVAKARVTTRNGAERDSYLASNDSEHGRSQNRSALIRVLQQNIEMEPEVITGQVPIFICTKPLDTAPIGNHALFRLGTAAAGSQTISLQPSDLVSGVTRSTCIQGEKGRNYPSDVAAAATCFQSSISQRCLEQEYAAYPLGKYCTLGPNSNTFVGHIARACGEAGAPQVWTPGWSDATPPAGTFAPSRNVTLIGGCSSIFCHAGDNNELEPYLPRVEPRFLEGGDYMDERGIVHPGLGPKY